MGNVDDSVYVFLEFNEKLTPNIFENELFLRVANLHKPNPLVQINDLVFKGIYDECIGTNLFFEEIEDPPVKTNIYEKETAIRLKHVLAQTKLIRLKQMKLPKKVIATKQNIDSIEINLNQDYQIVLEKLEQNLLNIDDLAKKETEDTSDNLFQETINFIADEQMSTEPEREIDSYLGLLQDKSQNSILEAKYERLKRLARRPVRRMKSAELVEECAPKYKESYEYRNLECKVLQNSDAFRTVNGAIIEKNFAGGVDMNRCVLQGLLSPSNDLFRTLSTNELNKLLTLDNLENLSIPLRYLVLKECVTKIEELIENTTPEELKEVDENGRNVQDVCNLFRKLVSALERLMSDNENETNYDIDLKIHDISDADYIKYKRDTSQELVDSLEILDEDLQIANRREFVKVETIRDDDDDSNENMED